MTTRAQGQVWIGGLAVMALLIDPGARAVAADMGVYLSANVGAAPRLFLRDDLNAALTDEFVATPLTQSLSTVDRRGATWSAAVGWWLAPTVAVEVAYLNAGEVDYHAEGTARVSGSDEVTNLDMSIKSRGATLALVWELPLWNQWGAAVRAGGYLGRASSQYVSTVGDDEVEDSVRKTSLAPLLGAGATFSATDHLIVKLEYLHIFGTRDAAFERRFETDLVTLGLTYAF